MKIGSKGPKVPQETGYMLVRRPEKLGWEQNLTQALLKADSDQLVLLGEIFNQINLVGQMNLLRQLINLGADMRIIEAGVRRIYFSKQKIDFSKISLDDSSNASLLVFHPEAPFDLLSQCFLRAFENSLSPEHRESTDLWEKLAKSVLIILTRAVEMNQDQEARKFLESYDEIGRRMKKILIMKRFLNWAREKTENLDFSKDKAPVDKKGKSIEELKRYLSEIESPDLTRAHNAAIEFLTQHDFIKISALLD